MNRSAGPSAETRFVALDAWRGISALVVALFHLFAVDHLGTTAFVRNSYLVVDSFFVLSGFVICHAFGERIGDLRSALAFMVRRFGRLWPLHVFVLALFLIWRLATAAVAHEPVFTPEYSAKSLLTNLLLLHSMGLHHRLTWNGPSWSISVEFYTYVVFAALLLLGRRRPVLPFALTAAVGAWILVRNCTYMDTTYDFGIFRALYGFFLGACVRRLGGRLLDLRPNFALMTALELGLAAAAWYFQAHADRLGFVAPLFYAVMVLVLAMQAGALSAVMSTAPMRHIGNWSYSIYLLHAFLANLIIQAALWLEARYGLPLFQVTQENGVVVAKRLFLGSLWRTDLLTVLYVAAVIGLSALTYRWVETPGRRWFNRLAKERFGPRPVAAAPVPAGS